MARESSTSLSGIEAEEEEAAAQTTNSPDVERSRYASAQSSFTRLERVRSRRISAVNARSPGMGMDGQAESVKGAEDITGPIFVDEKDEQEMRAVNAAEENIDDIDVDEGEMKRVIMGRIGGWVGWGLGWLDWRDDGEINDDDREASAPTGSTSIELDVEEVKRRLDSRERVIDAEQELSVDLPPPPSGQDAGLVSDARWLYNVAIRGL